MANPYIAVRQRIRRNQETKPLWLLPILAAVLMAPLLKPILLGFLEGGSVSRGIEAISFRLGAVVAGAMALHTYNDLVRGPDRAVLDLHPVQPRALLASLALQTMRERLYLPIMGAVILTPVAMAGHMHAWLGGVAVVFSAWFCAIGVGYTVHLGGVWAAMSPELASFMDAIRGDNPRLQAALIYAPGVVMAVVGFATAFAAAGVAQGLEGWTPGWVFLLSPLIVGAAGWALAGPASERHYVRTTALLAEIDGLFAGVEEEEDVHAVYLERFAQGRPELLRALRQGWRSQRVWATGAWMLGLLGAWTAWTHDAEGSARVLIVTGAAVMLVSAVPTRLVDGDPLWLDETLGVNLREVMLARMAVALMYAQGAILPAVLAFAIRQGPRVLPVFLGLEIVAVLASGIAAWVALQWRENGVWAYGPAAMLLWAVWLVIW